VTRSSHPVPAPIGRRALLAAAAVVTAAALTTARAQPAPRWPDRPVRIIVPFTPGGSTESPFEKGPETQFVA
jgi:hypothetical protein